MNEVINELVIKIERKNMFPKVTPIQEFIWDDMTYGVYENGIFQERKRNKNGCIIFRKNQPGRGIRLIHQENDPILYELHLSLPTSKEEIDDLFYCTVLIAKRQVCLVTLNDKDFSPKMYKSTFEDVVQYNLQYLHHYMGEILNENLIRDLECALGTYQVDMDIASNFWAGIDTDMFRDWLKDIQTKSPSSLSENHYD